MKNYITLICLLISLPALAMEPEQILNNYRQAEKYFHAGEHEKAKQLFQRIRQQVKQDGAFLMRHEIVETTRTQGRRVNKIREKKPIMVDLFPKRYLDKIEAVQLDHARRRSPPQLELKWLSLRDITRDNIMEGGETGYIVLQIKNSGNSKALDVTLKLKNTDRHIQIRPQITIGHMEAKSEIIREIPITAHKDIKTKNVKLSFIARERDGFDSNKLEVLFQTRPHSPPKLAVTQVKIKDLDGNGRVNPREVIDIYGTVTNIGRGLANQVNATLIIGDKNILQGPDNKAVQDLGSLAPQESKTVKFSIITNSRIRHGAHLPVSISLREKGGKEQHGSLENLKLVMHNQTTQVVPLAPKRPKAKKKPDIVDVDVYIPVSTQKNADAVAVLIGNSDYSRSELPRVDYAINDVRVVRNYLIKTLGYNQRNIILLEDATTGKFQETFGTKDNIAGKLNDFLTPNRSDVFIYYSGHGAPNLKDKSAYFVPVDANPNYIATSGYALKTLYENLAKMPIRHTIVVLDTCFSGNSPKGPVYPRASPVRLQPDISTPLPLRSNTVVYTSATNVQMSTWYPEKKHSLFTYFFLKGLGGAADSNKDLRLSSSELQTYLGQNVPHMAKRLSGMDQTPNLIQDRERILVDYSSLASN